MLSSQGFEQNHCYFGHAKIVFFFDLTSQMHHQDFTRCAATKSFLQCLTCSFRVSQVIAKIAPKKPTYRLLRSKVSKGVSCFFFQCFSRFTIHCFYQSFIHYFQMRQTIVCTFFVSRLVVCNLSFAA